MKPENEQKTSPDTVPTDHLAEWMAGERLDAYLGRRACFKLAVLAAVFSGQETLASVARRYGTSRQAAGKHAASARRIFTNCNPMG